MLYAETLAFKVGRSGWRKNMGRRTVQGR